MYIWSTLEKMQLCASSNGNCNRSTHLKIYIHVYMVNTRKNAIMCEFEWKL